MKPKTPQKKTPNKRQSRDFFQTPNYAVDLLMPYMPRNTRVVWECAAGEGKIVKRLKLYNYGVYATDLQYHEALDHAHNFLGPPPDELFRIDAIVTNPPFSLKEEFYQRCLLYGKPFALLLPMDMTQWNLEAVQKDGAQWLVPTRRIDYITPNGKKGKDSSAQFHSGWLTWGFKLPDSLTVVELTLQTKKNSFD